MGDSSCLMQPFSYASGIPNEPFEGNLVHALGHSVSFGRFISDSIAWDKWPSFSHNRYVEEAERYAQTGSVAQKKAFFEAHYKKVAAQRAAALLEQANAAAAEVSNNAAAAEPPKPPTPVPDPPKYMFCIQELREKVKEQNVLCSKVGLDKFESIEVVKVADYVVEESVLVDSSGYNSSVEMENYEKVHPITEFPVPEDSSAIAELSTTMQETYTHNVETVMEYEHIGTLQMEKPLLEECRRSDQEASLEQIRTLFSSDSSLMYNRVPKASISSAKTSASSFSRRNGSATSSHKEPKAPSSPSKLTTPCFPRRESNATSLIKVPKAPTSPSKPIVSFFTRKQGATPLHKERNLRKVPTSPAKSRASCFPIREGNAIPLPVTRDGPASLAKPTAACSLRREGNATPLHKIRDGPASPAKPTSSCWPRREGNVTPLHKNLSSASEDNKSSSPRSLQKSVSFTPIREFSRFTSTVTRKIENSRVGNTSFKTPKDCSTLLNTPIMISKDEVHKHPSVTPRSGNRRAKTPGESSSVTGGKTLRPKWHSTRTENKERSPFSSSSFSLRTEVERRRVAITNSRTVGKEHSSIGALSVPPHDSILKSSGSKHVLIQARNKETPTRSLKVVHEKTPLKIK